MSDGDRNVEGSNIIYCNFELNEWFQINKILLFFTWCQISASGSSGPGMSPIRRMLSALKRISRGKLFNAR